MVRVFVLFSPFNVLCGLRQNATPSLRVLICKERLGLVWDGKLVAQRPYFEELICLLALQNYVAFFFFLSYLSKFHIQDISHKSLVSGFS